MTTPIIITICILLLLAYIFDVTAAKTKIPSVILLLICGWAVKQGADFLELTIPDLSPVLTVLGTIGLILIVLEGAIELELNKSRLPFVGKSALIAMLPIAILGIGLAFAFSQFENVSMKIALANAIPFAVISSAIAIPTVQHLAAKDREFITYESSLSDIFGVLFFNFVVLNETLDVGSIGGFVVELLVILVITFVATLGLSYLLSKIRHHVKFAPIVVMLILIYTIAKIYHLPSLVFILIFGLFLSNLDELRHIKFIQRLHPDILNQEVHKFKIYIAEIAFLIRALFFLLFGFLIDTAELLNSQTIIWAIAITAGIFGIRWLLLKLFRIDSNTLIFIAPRGLITILLFLSIPHTQSLGIANKSLIIQVIILTALVMMFGMMLKKTAVESPVKKSDFE